MGMSKAKVNVLVLRAFLYERMLVGWFLEWGIRSSPYLGTYVSVFWDCKW